MSTLLADFRHAARSLRRTPTFTAVAVSSLALGIGATTAMFSVVHGVLLRPLPFAEPHEIVALYTRYLPTTGYDFPYFSVSGPEYEDLRQVPAFTSTAAYVWDTSNLAAEGGDPQRVQGVHATADLFRLLGVSAALGRGFAPGDDAPGGPCVAVLGHSLWRGRFASDPAVIGRDIRVDAAPCRVVGVMPQGFAFPDATVELWTPLALDPTAANWARASHNLEVVARLAPGVTPTAAEAELARLRARWSELDPEHHARGHFAVLLPLQQDLVGETRRPLLVLLGAVTFVLLIVCVNLAHLILTRAEARRREVALRAALGAGRGRLVRTLLTESLLLAGVGAVAGLVVANAVLAGLKALDPGSIPRLDQAGLDLRVLSFAAAAAVLTGVAVGTLPAWRGSAADPAEALPGTTRVRGSRASARFRRAVVVAEVALSLVLVVGATLLVRSYVQLRQVDLGFDPRGVLTFGLDVSAAAQPDPTRARELFAEVRRRLADESGVAAVGAISDLPLASAGAADDFVIAGRPPPRPGEAGLNARYLMVTPGALEALRVPLRSGRLIDERDGAGQPLVALVNETAARTFWPGDNPIGQRIHYYADDPPLITIVGIVGDVRSIDAATPAPPAVYVPLAQAPRPVYTGRFMTIVARATGPLANLLPAARRTVAELDPTLPLADPRPLEELVDDATGRARFTVTLMTAFAVVALLLAALGVYGVLAGSVQRRVSEIGVRMAVGASAADILRLVVGQGLSLTAAGIALGGVAAVGLTRVLSSLLFGVSARDPKLFAASVVVVLLSALIAVWIPAHRATRVDPRTALLQE